MLFDKYEQRVHQTRLIVYRADGTLVEITEFVKNWSVDLGNTAGLGNTGADGVVQQLNLVLYNDIYNSLAPKVKKGVLVPEMISFTGDGGSSYPNYKTDILPRTVALQDIYKTVAFNSYSTFSDFSTFGEVLAEATNDADFDIRLSSDKSNFLTSRPIDTRDTVLVGYSRWDITQLNSWNWHNGVYEPLLKDDAKIEFYLSVENIGEDTQLIVSDGSLRYSVTTSDSILPRTPAVIEHIAVDPLENNTHFPDVLYDVDTNEWVFTSNIDPGESYLIGFSSFTQEPELLFSGYLGDDINLSTDNLEISISCRDKSKILMETYLEGDDYALRSYPSADINVVTFIQNSLDDTLGTGLVVFKNPDGISYDIKLAADIYIGRSLHDMIQQQISLKGDWAGYEYNETTNDFELTGRIIPRDNTDTSFEIDYSTDMYLMSQKYSSLTKYNVINVLYYEDNGTGEAELKRVKYPEDTSGIVGRIRPGVVPAEETMGINTPELALDMAQKIWKDLQRVKDGTKVVTPLFFKNPDTGDRLRLFDRFTINNPYITDGAEFYSINSIRYSGNNETLEFNTEIGADVDSVVGGIYKWQGSVIRPGSYRQITARKLNNIQRLPKVTNLTVTSTGLTAQNLAPRAFAVLEWERPDGEYPYEYGLEVTETSDTEYADAEYYSVKAKTVSGAEVSNRKVILDPQKSYIWQVTAISIENLKGEVSDEGTISQIGDSTIPDPPSSLSVIGLNESLQVDFDPGPDADILGYVIYARKDNPPVPDSSFGAKDGTYDKRKQTGSLTTVLSGLGTDPGVYYVGVSSYDTSGNESIMTSAVSIEISPKLVLRTQQQVDSWLAEVVSATAVIPDYETAHVWAGDYNLGSAVSKLDNPINISKKKFRLIGIGDVKFNVYSEKADLIVMNSNDFILDNIDVDMIDVDEPVINVVTVKGYDSSVGRYEIRNCNIFGTNKPTTLFSHGIDPVDLTNKDVRIKNCYIDGSDAAVYIYNTFRKIVIDNLDINMYSSKYISMQFFAAKSKNLDIKNCRLTNGYIWINGADNTRINNNDFVYNTDISTLFTELIRVVGADVLDNFEASGNTISYDPGSITNGLTFISPFQVGTAVTITNNKVKGLILSSYNIIERWTYDSLLGGSDVITVAGTTVTGVGTTFLATYNIGDTVLLTTGGVAPYATRKVRNILSNTNIELDFAVTIAATTMISFSPELTVNNNSVSKYQEN